MSLQVNVGSLVLGMALRMTNREQMHCKQDNGACVRIEEKKILQKKYKNVLNV